jgi:tellurite methyltransferase
VASTSSIINLAFQSRVNLIKKFCENDDAPIIDLRSKEDFVLSHWRGTSHFSADNIIDRMFELPKRNQPLRLIGTYRQITVAQNQLLNKGYKIAANLEWNKEIEKQLYSLGLIAKGSQSTRLWSPAPIVELFQNKIVNQAHVGTALDIGCGAGRDSVYLATKNWKVDAVDYLPDALDKVKALAKRNSVEVNCHLLDLEKNADRLLEKSYRYQLILVSRYLHRPLFPLLKELLLPGGYIVYQTFMRGCELFGSPKNPRFLLEKDELAEFFAEFNILKNDRVYLDDGRPTNVFIAQNNLD